MVPGTVVKVIGDYIGGSYVATRVDHRFTGAGYVTRFTAGDRAPRGLADVLGGGGGGPSTLGAFNTLPTMLSAVVTDIAGHRDSADPGVSGLLVPTPADLAPALVRVLTDADERTRLTNGALAHAARFTWEATARATFEVLAAEAARSGAGSQTRR